ncbi:hypothetical protein ARMGADRAFT_1077622 [Armillaria gallica]|uniref:Uncharacterized protein n=1 Tax=Armillaria gallica TaxID=47427 RepID=A0A2H3DLK6_ARMGA|nr:hypothetical protein ARMGADRAFT_1077622 [Armillaria gallica]
MVRRLSEYPPCIETLNIRHHRLLKEWKIIVAVIAGSFLTMSPEYEAAQHRNRNSSLCHLYNAYPRLTKIKMISERGSDRSRRAKSALNSWCGGRCCLAVLIQVLR